MMKTYFTNVRKSNSLTAKIRDAELQLVIRQRGVGVRTDALVKNISRQMTAPSTLLMSVSIGFILGELTQRRISSNPVVDNKHHTRETSPLKVALNLMASAHTLYTALPIAWIIKTFRPSAKPGRKAHEGQTQPIASASCAAKDCGKPIR